MKLHVNNASDTVILLTVVVVSFHVVVVVVVVVAEESVPSSVSVDNECHCRLHLAWSLYLTTKV